MRFRKNGKCIYSFHDATAKSPEIEKFHKNAIMF